jgi:hypothetical protein
VALVSGNSRVTGYRATHLLSFEGLLQSFVLRLGLLKCRRRLVDLGIRSLEIALELLYVSLAFQVEDLIHSTHEAQSQPFVPLSAES